MPAGQHEACTLYYVFGRYPKAAAPDYPLVDLVLCHGDFLNAHHDYQHQNKSFRGLGSYGDVLVRDRKMYVVPTPYSIAIGLEHQFTLILPADADKCKGLVEVGRFSRREADELVVAYSFDLTENILRTEMKPNPTAGMQHEFAAYRMHGSEGPAVVLR